MNCFHYESKFKIIKKIFFFFLGGGGGGAGEGGRGRASVSELFEQRIQI